METDFRREQRAPASRDCKKMPATPAPSSRRGWKPCAASSTTSSGQPDDAGRNEQRAVAAPLPAQARARFTTHGVAFAIPSARCAIDMTKSWLEAVQADIASLRQTADVLGGATVEERQRNFDDQGVGHSWLGAQYRGMAVNQLAGVLSDLDLVR